MPRYYLKADWQKDYQEVTKKQFIAAERAAGFRSKLGPNAVATGGFSGNGVSGKVEYDAQPAAKRASKKT